MSSAVLGGVAGLVAAAVLVWPSGRGPADRILMLRPSAADQPRADRAPADQLVLQPDLVMELIACGLRAGLGVTDALAAATPAAGDQQLGEVLGRLRLGVPPAQAWASVTGDYSRLAQALVLADLSGAPAAAVVTRAATDWRAARREQTELAAARLGVRLVLPLGLAVLPGFVLLAVAPIVLGLASSMLAAG